jgi:SAM-dependent methyltransferase
MRRIFLRSSRRSISIHPSASSGFSKENIDRYEHGRPNYSQEAIDQILELLAKTSPSSPSARDIHLLPSSASQSSPCSLLEIGAGTGKFTNSFLQRAQEKNHLWPWFKNCKYLALEPSEFIEKLHSLPFHIEVQKGVAEDIPAENETMDGVMVAQAFHWMSNEKSLREIHRVLKPHCPLVLIWNGYDDQVDWIQQFQKQIILPRYPADTPKYQSGDWENVFRGPLGSSLFSPLQKFFSYHSIQGDASMVVNRALSTSVISNQSEEIQREVEREVLDLISSHPDTRDIPRDSPEGFTMRYQTLIAFTHALPS